MLYDVEIKALNQAVKRNIPWLVVLVASIVCQGDANARGQVDKSSKPTSPPASSRIVGQPTSDAEPPRSIRARGRVVAIGDLHGDLAAARRALRCAKVIDKNDQWIGGRSVVVQTGDVLDRGNEERPLAEWLDRLAEQAKTVGGALYQVQGNHEVMNVASDFRYVTEAGFSAFADYSQSPVPPRGQNLPGKQRGRLNAFLPGGPWANRLAAHPVVLQVNDSVFVHGGLLPQHLPIARHWLLARQPLGGSITHSSQGRFRAGRCGSRRARRRRG